MKNRSHLLVNRFYNAIKYTYYIYLFISYIYMKNYYLVSSSNILNISSMSIINVSLN